MARFTPFSLINAVLAAFIIVHASARAPFWSFESPALGRFWQGATVIVREEFPLMVVFGGFPSSSRVDLLDISTYTWVTAAVIGERVLPRNKPTIVPMADQNVLIYGGQALNGQQLTDSHILDTLAWEMSAATVTGAPSLPNVYCRAYMARTGGASTLLVSVAPPGANGNAPSLHILDSGTLHSTALEYFNGSHASPAPPAGLGPIVSAPSPRSDASCAIYNTSTSEARLVMFGGNSPTAVHNDTYVFAFESRTWHRLAMDSPFTPPSQQGGTLVAIDVSEFPHQCQSAQPSPSCPVNGSHMLLLMGGNALPASISGHAALASTNDTLGVFLFDPSTQHWRVVTPPVTSPGTNPAPVSFPSVVHWKHVLYLYGGLGESGTSAYTWELSVPSLTWRRHHKVIGELPPALVHSAAVRVPSMILYEALWVFGGSSLPSTFAIPRAPAASELDLHNTLHTFHYGTMEWITAVVQGTAPEPRAGHAFVNIPVVGRSLVYGGVNSTGHAISSLRWLRWGVNDTTQLPPVIVPAPLAWLPVSVTDLAPDKQKERAFASVGYFTDVVVIVGGLCDVQSMTLCNDGSDLLGLDFANGDVSDGSWIPLFTNGDGPPPQFGAAHAVCEAYFVVTGGYDENYQVLDETYLLIISSFTWTKFDAAASTMLPGPIVFAVAVPAQNGGKMVMYGGWTGQVVRDDIQILDVASGAWVTPSTYQTIQRPAGRFGSVGVTLGQKIPVFGGAYINRQPTAEFDLYWSGLENTFASSTAHPGNPTSALCAVLPHRSCNSLRHAIQRCAAKGVGLNVDSGLELDISIGGTVHVEPEGVHISCPVSIHSYTSYAYGHHLPTLYFLVPSTTSTIDCSGVDPSKYCLTLTAAFGSNTTISFRNVRITGARGGAVNVRSSVSLHIYNSVIRDNSRESKGACLQGYRAQINLFFVYFKNCTASAGAAIDVVSSTVVVRQSTIYKCHARSWGGAFNALASNITLLQYTALVKNTASEGGALRLQNGHFACNTVWIWGNTGLYGGGIFGDTAIMALESQCKLTENVAHHGGALYTVDVSTLNTDKAIIMNNTGGLGGGLYSDSAVVFLKDTTLQLNKATIGGGAIFWDSFSRRPEMDTATYNLMAGKNTQPWGLDIASSEVYLQFEWGNLSAAWRQQQQVMADSGVAVPAPLSVTVRDYYGQLMSSPKYFVAGDRVQAVNADRDGVGIVGGTSFANIEGGVAVFKDLVVIQQPGQQLKLAFTWKNINSLKSTVVQLRACQRGQYSLNNQCTGCPAGRSAPKNRTISAAPSLEEGCASCPPNTYSGVGAVECTWCSPLTFQPSAGSHRCVTCDTGRFFLPPSSCGKCPSPGAVCDNVAYAKKNFYVSRAASGDVVALDCPRGRCLDALDKCAGSEAQMFNVSRFAGMPLPASMYTQHQLGVSSCCGPNRVSAIDNPLCGQCLPGYYEWSGNCVQCNGVNVLYVSLFLVLSWLALLLLHRLSQSTTALSNILFYFIQIANLFVAPSGYLSSVLNVLSFSAPDAQVCVAPVAPISKLLLRLALPAVMLAELLVTGCALNLVWRVREWLHRRKLRRQNSHIVIPRPALPPLRKSPYVRTICALYLFSFTTVADTVLRFFSCVQVTDQASVVASEPAIVCYSGEWRSVLPVVIVLTAFTIGVIPLLLLGALVYARHNRLLYTPRHRQRYGIFYEVYQPTLYWWQVFVLLRRTVLVIVAAVIVNFINKLLVASACNVLFLLMHLLLRPYRHMRDNYIAAALLTLITFITLALAHFPPPLSAPVELVFLLVIFVPVAGIFLAVVGPLVWEKGFGVFSVGWFILREEWAYRSDSGGSSRRKPNSQRLSIVSSATGARQRLESSSELWGSMSAASSRLGTTSDSSLSPYQELVDPDE